MEAKETSGKFRLPPNTALGAVELLVSDVKAFSRFYRNTTGLSLLSENVASANLGSGGRTVLRLVERKDLGLSATSSAGLFHFAVVIESPAALAKVLSRLLELEPTSYSGSADHITSEAFYGSDPDGNGFEIYADRPKASWKMDHETIIMATMYLDAKDFILVNSQKKGGDDKRLGHIHLKVGSLAEARAFYEGGLGFSVTNDKLPGAIFVSAGGYHHHIGLNVWQSQGAAKRTETLGLSFFEIYLPSGNTLTELKDNLTNRHIPYGAINGGIEVADPWGNMIHVLSAGY